MTSEIARSRYIIVAGECVVVDHRVEYRVKQIEPCSAERGRNAYPVPFRLVLKVAGRNGAPVHFLLGIPGGVSGLGLVRALLPRRSAQLALDQAGDQVLTTVVLKPPGVQRVASNEAPASS